MAEYEDREHYIPIRKDDLIDLICCDKQLSDDQREQFRQFCTMICATLHFEYHQHFENLKNEYAPFDPDRVTKDLHPLSDETKLVRLDGLLERFTWLMQRANFRRLDRAAIEEAMEEASDWGINMDVCFDAFEKLEIFVRGDVIEHRTRRPWYKFFREETVEVPTYQRFVLILKLKPHKRIPKNVDTHGVYLKIFKGIPKADIEMLLPGTKLKMPKLQVYKLGGSIVGGLGYIIYQILGKVGTILAALAGGITAAAFVLVSPIAALGGYGYKQWHSYQTTKTNYMLQLARNLYYLNLDNNSGVLNHLLDEAEEQECREVILAYFYLWRSAGSTGWSKQTLDDYIEMELEAKADLKCDFEIDDAIDKLERMQLVSKNDDRYVAVPIDKALQNLDYAWDNYFQYNKTNTPSAQATGT